MLPAFCLGVTTIANRFANPPSSRTGINEADGGVASNDDAPARVARAIPEREADYAGLGGPDEDAGLDVGDLAMFGLEAANAGVGQILGRQDGCLRGSTEGPKAETDRHFLKPSATEIPEKSLYLKGYGTM